MTVTLWRLKGEGWTAVAKAEVECMRGKGDSGCKHKWTVCDSIKRGLGVTRCEHCSAVGRVGKVWYSGEVVEDMQTPVGGPVFLSRVTNGTLISAPQCIASERGSDGRWRTHWQTRLDPRSLEAKR